MSLMGHGFVQVEGFCFLVGGQMIEALIPLGGSGT